MIVSSALSVAGLAQAAETEPMFSIEAFPKTLSVHCRDGSARLYDECGSQADILAAARIEAINSGKTTLLLYGAEWCVWCFVLNDTLHGTVDSTYFEYEQDQVTGKWVMQEKIDSSSPGLARSLNEYVAKHFVIAHIEADQSPDGPATVNSIGIDSSGIGFYPFIATLKADGQYASHVFGYEVMGQNKTRKDSKGQALKQFDRAALLDRLTAMRDAARAN